MKHSESLLGGSGSGSGGLDDSPLKVSEFMSVGIIKIDITDCAIGVSIGNMGIDIDKTLDYTLKLAKDLMYQYKIEKIPIVRDSELIGLITLKNIRHYENNKTKACIDKNGALCVGGAIGIVDDYMERLAKLVNVGVDLVCIDVANGFNTNVFGAIRDIRAKYPELVLMVGNVCNWQGYEAF